MLDLKFILAKDFVQAFNQAYYHSKLEPIKNFVKENGIEFTYGYDDGQTDRIDLESKRLGLVVELELFDDNVTVMELTEDNNVYMYFDSVSINSPWDDNNDEPDTEDPRWKALIEAILEAEKDNQ